MSGLSVDEKLVDLSDFQVVDQAEVDPHPHARQQQHRFFAGDRVSGFQNSISTTDLVVQHLAAFGQEGLPCFAFVFDQLWDDVGKTLDQLRLALAQSLLVGNLIEIAVGLGALAVQATDGEVDFLEGAEEFVEMIRLAKGGQVEHDSDPNPGADVGRAGREVPKFLAEGDVEVLFEAVVEVVDLFSLTMMDALSSSLSATPRGPSPSLSSREIRCRSTMNWRSSSLMRSTSK